MSTIAQVPPAPREMREWDRPQGPADPGSSPLEAAPLLGQWVNFDKASRGVVKVLVTPRAGGILVRAHGADTPAPRDWGEQPGTIFSGGVSQRDAVGFYARFDFGFSRVLMAAYLNKRLLVVDCYTTFHDGSGRSNYFARDHFYLA
jgi:hypothetical protein